MAEFGGDMGFWLGLEMVNFVGQTFDNDQELYGLEKHFTFGLLDITIHQ